MPAKRQRPPKRGDDKATLSISLPKALKDAIDKAAKADKRSISNYIVNEMAKKLAEDEAKDG